MLRLSSVFCLICFCLLVACLGCGTDLKPTPIYDLFKDPGDYDELAPALISSEVEGDKLIATIDIPKVEQFINKKIETETTLKNIMDNGEQYLGRIIEFEAPVLRADNHHFIDLDTQDRRRRFYLHTHGKDIYYLDDNGNEIDIQPNEVYKFKVRLTEIKIHADHHMWEYHAHFILHKNSNIAHQPLPVQL